jgi:hypothetical protein
MCSLVRIRLKVLPCCDAAKKMPAVSATSGNWKHKTVKSVSGAAEVSGQVDLGLQDAHVIEFARTTALSTQACAQQQGNTHEDCAVDY